MIRQFCVVCAIIFTCFTGQADTIHVPADYTTIQAAINASDNGDTILAAPTVYRNSGNRDLDFGGRLITLRSEGGPEVTIIDCDGSESDNNRAFYFHTGESNSAIIDGFTIRDGYSTSGGAVYCTNSDPMFVNCIFVNNEATDLGGAVTLWTSNAHFIDCVFENNISYSGGGICISTGSNPVIASCVFKYNQAYYGGAINVNGNNIPLLTNCLIYSNHGTAGVAVYSSNGATPIFNNCTISDNTASYGSALHVYNSIVTMVDSILWDNTTIEVDVQSGGPPVITYSNVEQTAGVYHGDGNINGDPQFVDPIIQEFQLSHTAAGQSSTSPCVNAGSDQSSNICFQDQSSETCMDELSTRTDSVNDSDIVDMGYHYPGTQDPTPTAEPTTGPTPTPEPCTETGTTLWMPAHEFAPGEMCACIVTICNAEGSSMGYPLFVILDVFSSYYFAPSFSDFDNYLATYPQFDPGNTVVEVLPYFEWPTDVGAANGLYFYAALTDPGFTSIVGKMDQWEFGWE